MLAHVAPDMSVGGDLATVEFTNGFAQGGGKLPCGLDAHTDLHFTTSVLGGEQYVVSSQLRYEFVEVGTKIPQPFKHDSLQSPKEGKSAAAGPSRQALFDERAVQVCRRLKVLSACLPSCSADDARQAFHFPESFMGTFCQPLGAFVHDQFEESSKVIRVIPIVPAQKEQQHGSARFDFHIAHLASPITDRTCGGKAL